jgi:hypothetical protein
MKSMSIRILILAAATSVSACGGGSASPTAPTSTTPPPTSTTPLPPAPVPTPPPAAPANIAGTYNLVLTASSSCAASLPAAGRVVRYVATVTQSGSQFQASLTGSTFSTALFQGTVAGQTVTLSVVGIGDLNIGTIGLVITGRGTATVGTGGTISGTFDGSFNNLAGNSCNAFDHQFQLMRR